MDEPGYNVRIVDYEVWENGEKTGLDQKVSLALRTQLVA